ncbi:hypothetical protein CHELA20_54525 [Hyphomicrobiales bacterium]|nr:hypothetical protein CHELA41_20401 [Hyphomicrobiales bacterium]CAH1686438.1 hypothetical protein CHELA20_54525 [Hyphomicrobiales bacterium]
MPALSKGELKLQVGHQWQLALSQDCLTRLFQEPWLFQEPSFSKNRTFPKASCAFQSCLSTHHEGPAWLGLRRKYFKFKLSSRHGRSLDLRA